jgi:hypothetical protein
VGFSKASTQRWLAFAAALAAAFALLPATGGEARKATCKVRGSHTHLQTKSLRVFYIFRGSNTGAGSSKFYACYRKTGRKTKIGVETGPKQTYTWKPAGRLLPYSNSSPDRETFRLLDVKSGKLKFSFVILEKDGGAGGLVATPSGGLAFVLDEVSEDPEVEPVRFVAGHKAGTGKHAFTKLTPAHPRTPHSLTRKGDVVSWRIYEERTVPPSWITGSANLGR